jgi:hypothetical protein
VAHLLFCEPPFLLDSLCDFFRHFFTLSGGYFHNGLLGLHVVPLPANPDFSPRLWKGGALQAAEELESAVISEEQRRRRISQCLENTQSEILRFAQDDSIGGFFRSL